MFGAIIVKLILMPAVAIPLVLWAARANLLPAHEPMLLMIIMVQSGVPSSQTALALMVAAGLQKESSELSVVYLPMYACSVLTMAVVILAAVQSIEELEGVGVPSNVTP